MALSILLSGNALLLVPLAPILTGAIADHGRRAGYAILGGLALLLGLPRALVATGAARSRSLTAGPAGERGATIRQAMQTTTYWKIIAGVIASALALGGFLNQLSPLLVSRGIPPGQAASLMALLVLMVVIRRIAIGALLDALRPPLVFMLVMIGAAAGAALLLTDAPSPLLCAFVVMLLARQWERRAISGFPDRAAFRPRSFRGAVRHVGDVHLGLPGAWRAAVRRTL